MSPSSRQQYNICVSYNLFVFSLVLFMYFPGLLREWKNKKKWKMLREWKCCVLVTALSPQTDQTGPTFIIRESSNKLTNTNNILQQQLL